MLTRQCVGRIKATGRQYRPLLSGGTRPCMREGLHVGKDGKYRCADHHQEHRGTPKPPEVSERTAIEMEDET